VPDKKMGVVVTGAAGDLGRTLCRSFLKDGFSVFAADLSPAAECPGLEPVRIDVTVHKAMRELAERAGRETHLQAWINAAGLFVSCPVTAATDTDWARIIAVNLTGTYYGCAVALPVLAAVGGGRIVNVGSISGQVGGGGVHPAYGASKAGVHALTRTYATEGARHGVLCNAVAPGLLEAGVVREFDERQREKLAQAVPLRRLGGMDEVVRVIRFLASADNTYMTGAIVPINGGAYMPS
jgi:NAD(P)-dependent dehydrogenase (short-subunit alcohol dehydrogenase family)